RRNAGRAAFDGLARPMAPVRPLNKLPLQATIAAIATATAGTGPAVRRARRRTPRAGGNSRPQRRATRWIEGVESVQIQISVRHGQINDDTQQFIRDKAEKLLHIFERLTMIEVTVDLKKELKAVEFVVQAEHKHDFVARESNADVLAAVDLVLDKLQGQLRR